MQQQALRFSRPPFSCNNYSQNNSLKNPKQPPPPHKKQSSEAETEARCFCSLSVVSRGGSPGHCLSSLSSYLIFLGYSVLLPSICQKEHAAAAITYYLSLPKPLKP